MSELFTPIFLVTQDGEEKGVGDMQGQFTTIRADGVNLKAGHAGSPREKKYTALPNDRHLPIQFPIDGVSLTRYAEGEMARETWQLYLLSGGS